MLLTVGDTQYFNVSVVKWELSDDSGKHFFIIHKISDSPLTISRTNVTQMLFFQHLKFTYYFHVSPNRCPSIAKHRYGSMYITDTLLFEWLEWFWFTTITKMVRTKLAGVHEPWIQLGFFAYVAYVHMNEPKDTKLQSDDFSPFSEREWVNDWLLIENL